MDNHIITFIPENIKAIVSSGSTIKEAITRANLDFDFPCGGRGTCGKCRIRILDKVINPTQVEIMYLSKEEISEGVHLACQTKIHDNITVQLNIGKSLIYNILLSTFQRSFALEPLVKKIYIEVDLPTLGNSKSDLNRIREKLILKDISYKNSKIGFRVLRELSIKLREAQHHITVLTDEYNILGIEKGNTTDKMLGIAFDIGTTTIVGYLMDLNTGKELAVSSSLNPQVKFGADVISRITYSNQNENGLKIMQSAVLEVIDKLIGDTIDKSGMSRRDIYSITIVGNTCMHHLFLGLSPRYVAATPYVPVISEPIELSSSELDLHINTSGRVFMPPVISGFVGSDTVGVVLATEMDKGKDIKLAIDIGTNGEIVLGSSKKLVSCSAAAGPAFEGAQISCGMRGSNGAIDHVTFKGKLSFRVIGNEKPQGICGSGLLDAVAGLVELGIINKRGKLLSPDEFTDSIGKVYGKYIFENDGTNAFLLVPRSQTEHGRPIMITQNDISSLQLAKGAISAGINVLIEECGITIDDINEVLLAGAFGNYLDPHSACVIGLIPRELESKIKMVGNAAGAGSKLALLSRTEYNRSVEIADLIKYVELGAYKHFNRKFAEGMRFQ